MNGKLKEQKVSRVERFSSRDDKVALIKAVEAQPVIWDLTHKGHFHSAFVSKSWEAIAKQLKKDAKHCKNAWKSLRDSMRYHQRISKKKKRGSANDDIDWVFAPFMTFLPELSVRRRRTKLPKPTSAACTSDEQSEEDVMFNENLEDDLPNSSHDENVYENLDLELEKELDLDMENQSSSSYSYTPTKKRKIAATESSSLTQKFTEYVDIQKSSISQAPKIRSMVTYWGDIIQELPKDLQDEAEESITQLLYDLRKTARNLK